MTQSNTDSEGRVAAAGNITLSSYGVGLSLPNSNGARDDLIAGGNLNYTNGTVYNGNAVYGGTASLNGVTFLHGNARQGTVIEFNAARTELRNTSTSWAQLAANGTTLVQFGSITLTGTSPQLNVFAVAGSALASANGFTINAPASSTVIVNVSGTSGQMRNFGITLQGVNRTSIVYNFSQATTLTVEGIGIEGSIMAPFAAVTFNNGQINGTLVGATLDGNGESHHYPFVGCPPGMASTTVRMARFEVDPAFVKRES